MSAAKAQKVGLVMGYLYSNHGSNLIQKLIKKNPYLIILIILVHVFTYPFIVIYSGAYGFFSIALVQISYFMQFYQLD